MLKVVNIDDHDASETLDKLITYFYDLKTTMNHVNCAVCLLSSEKQLDEFYVETLENFLGQKLDSVHFDILANLKQVSKDATGVVHETWRRLSYRTCDQFFYIQTETQEIVWSMCVWLGKTEITKNSQFHMHIRRSFRDMVLEKINRTRFDMNSIQFNFTNWFSNTTPEKLLLHLHWEKCLNSSVTILTTWFFHLLKKTCWDKNQKIFSNIFCIRKTCWDKNLLIFSNIFCTRKTC